MDDDKSGDWLAGKKVQQADSEADAAVPTARQPALTDREVSFAVLKAVGELYLRITGEPLVIDAPVEGGYIRLRLP